MADTIPFSPPDIGEAEIDAVARVMRSGWITTGPETAKFETEISAYTGAGGTAAVNSATAALELILRCLGVGPGDEVITSAYTYSASASAIAHVGAVPVLVDTAPGSYAIDPEQIHRSITDRTKAVIPVDIGGVMCDYDEIRAVADERKGLHRPGSDMQAALGRIAIIADAAHSMGASRGGVSSGSAADFTAFSFHAVKNLTTAEGGAATWSAALPGGADVHRRLRLLALHGQTKDALSKSVSGGWEYDIVTLGYKANLTDIAAAIGRVQLARYDGMIDRRHELVQYYDSTLAGRQCASLVHLDATQRSSAHLYMLQLGGRGREFRDGIIAGLASQGITANVHFKPLPMMTAYRALGFSASDFPNAIEQFSNELSLPLHSTLTEAQIDRIADTLVGLGL
ncbi:DegT/DnrJ/EryC1/StrS aminotransferase family protein [Microbacterium esteraromaticum]|uniref:DegT/DnrJ/EryC1/StrS aminotransferase family protein n=1 Tax=Microbacterium esteraromaticum TaxID=57043 RepID=A0A7D8ACV8_9MICO|nr:DegT/DnrJ/EryC1/StrS aminotransferase family protein [Microbacterium esteraromaticum]QMU97424.1 DegT/DnrJ/EryC1/StrS aminotransferase family protein [Microbacterium esteraromaticum]